MGAWKDISLAQPADGATVWVRRGWLEYPFLATWHAATSEFITELTGVVGDGFGDTQYNAPLQLLPTLKNGLPWYGVDGAAVLYTDIVLVTWCLAQHPYDDGTNADYSTQGSSAFGPWMAQAGDNPTGIISPTGLTIPWYVVSRWRPQ